MNVRFKTDYQQNNNNIGYLNLNINGNGNGHGNGHGNSHGGYTNPTSNSQDKDKDKEKDKKYKLTYYSKKRNDTENVNNKYSYYQPGEK